MVGKLSARQLPDTYLNLVKRFPLIHIRDDAHRDKAPRCKGWLRGMLASGARVTIPAIIDDEIRREWLRADRIRPDQIRLEGSPRSILSVVNLASCLAGGAVLIEASRRWADACQTATSR